MPIGQAKFGLLGGVADLGKLELIETQTITTSSSSIDFTNVPTNGVSTFTLQITQDTTDRTVAINAITVNGGSDVTAKTASGAGFTMSTGSGAIDLVTFLFVDAGTPLLNALQDFS